MSIILKPETVTDYVQLVTHKQRFTLLNYGDGEWSCILGRTGGNCNGEAYTSAVQNALIKTFKPNMHPTYYGFNPGAKLLPEVDQWRAANNVTNLHWVNKEILANANVRGELGPFIAAIRTSGCVVLVGPEHLTCNKAVTDLWRIKHTVTVPTNNAFLALNTTLQQVRKIYTAEVVNTLIVCSGMAAKPLIHTLSAEMSSTIIDMGATLDPYAGLYTRKSYKKPEFLPRLANSIAMAKHLAP